MRELIEIDWERKRAVLEFYLSAADVDHEHLRSHILSACEDASRKAEVMEIYIFNTGEASRALAMALEAALDETGWNISHKACVGF